MSISAVSNASAPFAARRLIDSGAKIHKLSELPGSAERGMQLLEHIVADAGQVDKRVQSAAVYVSHSQANVLRVQNTIEALPGSSSAKERQAWNSELQSAQSNVQDALDEMELAQTARASLPERNLRMQKLIAGLLGVSPEEARSMYAGRLDKMA